MRKAIAWTLTAMILTSSPSSALAADPRETVEGVLVSSAMYDEERIELLAREISAGTYPHINGIVVLRDGELLIEHYFGGAARDVTHNPRSVGKTIASTVLGIAIDEGFIQSVDQPLSDFYDLHEYANYSEKKARVTLRHLVTMTSGFEGFDFDPESIGNEELMYPQEDWVRWTLDLPMAGDREPGDEWRYFTAGIVVLGDILNSAVPGGLVAYTHRKVFGPMGITNYEWQYTPQRVGNTAGGLQLTPIGFAKWGQLYKNGGSWDGCGQLLPSVWVRESLQAHVETTEEPNRYGYLWWHRTYEVDGAEFPVAYCSGNGGNKVFVFEDQPLVIVITASAYGQRYAHSQVDEILEQFLLPAVIQR